jgi:hypothetical protein
MDIVVAVLLGAIGSIVAAELYALGPAIADTFIRRAVARLPKHERARFLEEWQADNDDFPGSVQKVLHAIGCCIGAHAVAKILAKPKMGRQSSKSKKLSSSQKKWATLNERVAAFRAHRRALQELDGLIEKLMKGDESRGKE